MKDVEFLGDSLDVIRSFPDEAKQDIGYQLDRVQRGLDPDDWKPMKTIGKGVREIRTRTSDGAYRTVYIATMEDAVYVLHAFQKKTAKTRKHDLDLAAKRLKELMRRR